LKQFTNFFYILFFFITFLMQLTCKSTSSKEEKPEPPKQVYKEIKIGRALAAKFIKKYGLVQDANQTKYLNFIGNKIAENSPRQELIFKFGILNTDEVNAFACPGGYIFITKGALALIDNEAELVGVLAHEVSHVSLFHSGKYEAKEEIWIDLVASMLSPGGDMVSTVMEAASRELEESMLENGRQKEFETQADASASILVSQLGYDLTAYVGYLKKMKSTQGNQVFIKTHPPVDERVQSIEKFIADQKNTKVRKNKR
jgi:predicted Zn-dependent protease